MFGELLGLWAAVTWDLLGRPSPVLLVEAGPGRGTLMADALRAIAQVAPAFRAALSLHLIETSPRLRALQAARLPDAAWHESLATVPQKPLLLLANEFLDALPIRQFVRRGHGWVERFVGPKGYSSRRGLSRRGLSKKQREKKVTPPPLERRGARRGVRAPNQQGGRHPSPQPPPSSGGGEIYPSSDR